jgi:glucuronokinase
VAQVYDGLVYMDFNRELMERQGYGRYEPLDPARLPNLYIAYRTDLAEGTEVFHNNIRARWESGEPLVVEAMKQWAGLTEQVREKLRQGRGDEIAPILNENFDLRRRVYRISEENIRMVETARAAGASSKFTGSGGAIVGTYADDAMYRRLEESLGALGVKVIKPQFVPPAARS